MQADDSKRVLRALGLRVRNLRNEQGYSQEAFADRCGVHRTFMGTVERGESNLSFENTLKIARALDITLSALFTDIEGGGASETKPTKARKKLKVTAAGS